MENETDDLFTKFNEAEQLEADGRKDEAIKSYSDFITVGESRLLEGRGDNHTPDLSALQEKLCYAYNNRGFCYYQKVEFKLAVEDYTKALTYNNTMAVVYYNRGLIHYRLGRFQDAVEDMKGTLSLLPDFEPAQKCLAQSLEDLKTLQ